MALAVEGACILLVVIADGGPLLVGSLVQITLSIQHIFIDGDVVHQSGVQAGFTAVDPLGEPVELTGVSDLVNTIHLNSRFIFAADFSVNQGIGTKTVIVTGMTQVAVLAADGAMGFLGTGSISVRCVLCQFKGLAALGAEPAVVLLIQHGPLISVGVVRVVIRIHIVPVSAADRTNAAVSAGGRTVHIGAVGNLAERCIRSSDRHGDMAQGCIYEAALGGNAADGQLVGEDPIIGKMCAGSRQSAGNALHFRGEAHLHIDADGALVGHRHLAIALFLRPFAVGIGMGFRIPFTGGVGELHGRPGNLRHDAFIVVADRFIEEHLLAKQDRIILDSDELAPDMFGLLTLEQVGNLAGLELLDGHGSGLSRSTAGVQIVTIAVFAVIEQADRHGVEFSDAADLADAVTVIGPGQGLTRARYAADEIVAGDVAGVPAVPDLIAGSLSNHTADVISAADVGCVPAVFNKIHGRRSSHAADILAAADDTGVVTVNDVGKMSQARHTADTPVADDTAGVVTVNESSVVVIRALTGNIACHAADIFVAAEVGTHNAHILDRAIFCIAEQTDIVRRIVVEIQAGNSLAAALKGAGVSHAVAADGGPGAEGAVVQIALFIQDIRVDHDLVHQLAVDTSIAAVDLLGKPVKLACVIDQIDAILSDNLYHCAKFLQLCGNILRFFPGDFFLQCLGAVIDQLLRFLQAQAGNLADNLDDLKLGIAGRL